MEIWNTFLLFGSVVITVTSVIMMGGITSDSRVSNAYKKAHLDLKLLAERYIQLLETELQIGTAIVSSSCKKQVVLKQLNEMNSTLVAFYEAMKDLRYDCTSSPPSVEHASAVVTKVNKTQQVATYTCDMDYTIGGGEKKVWCDHTYGIWGQSTLQCVECFNREYEGQDSTTQGGIQCQRWDSQSPHRHGYESSDFPEKNISLAENYCRMPGRRNQEPWCYTTDASFEWDYCGIPSCRRQSENDCGSPRALPNAKSHHGYTSNGARTSYVCLNFSSSMENTYCPVSVCKNSGWTDVSISCGEQDCFRSSREYTGKRNCTVSGRTCQEWAERFPHDHRFLGIHFPGGSIDNAGNYCRDPDGTGTPWCYTTDSDVRYELCDVPRCDKFS